MKTIKRENFIDEYNSGTRFFQYLNLNNISFQALNLSDIVFSNCQCKSTNFSKVNFTNSKFVGVETGLSNYWFSILIILIFFITCIQGLLLFFLNLMTIYIQSATNIFVTYFLFLSFIGIFFITIFTPYITKKFFAHVFNLPILFLLTNSFLGGLSGYQTLPTLIVLTFLGVFNGLCIGFLIISLAISFTITKLIANNFLLIFLIILSSFISLGISLFFAVGIMPNLILTIYMISLALYLANNSLKIKSNSWLYQIGILVISFISTKFYQSNLTNVSFQNMNLEYLDLRKATLSNCNLDDFDKKKLLLSD